MFDTLKKYANGNDADSKPDLSGWLEFSKAFGSIEEDRQRFLNPPDVIETGFKALDEGYLNGGMVPGMYCLMAEPGAGKSALALQISLNVTKAGGRVLYLSAEMERSQCVARAASNLDGGFGWNDWDFMSRLSIGKELGLKALGGLAESCPGLTFAEVWDRSLEDVLALSANARANGMDLLVVDYLQAMEPPADYEGDTFGAITEVAKAFTRLARELGVPVILISSMGRAARQLEGGETIGGGYGSSRIEYDATAQFTLKKTAEECDGGRVVALHLTKNRRGPLTPKDGLHLVFDGKHNRLSEF